jgi:hypothetical protein
MNQQHFSQNGYAIIPKVLNQARLSHLQKLFAPSNQFAGDRCLLEHEWCKQLAREIRQHPDIAQLIPIDHLAVQCTYFEKSTELNWLVPIHQDLSIPVAEKVASPALIGWSIKDGNTFVQAPIPILAKMVALRLHIDPCVEEDGPLRVIAGSHLDGKVSAEQAIRIKNTASIMTCEIQAGGVIAMRPLLLHMSSKATGTGRRRLLHFVFAPPDLPFGLKWKVQKH